MQQQHLLLQRHMYSSRSMTIQKMLTTVQQQQ
jgi:hypothetical protein